MPSDPNLVCGCDAAHTKMAICDSTLYFVREHFCESIFLFYFKHCDGMNPCSKQLIGHLVAALAFSRVEKDKLRLLHATMNS